MSDISLNLKESFTFVAETFAEFTNSLPRVARKPFADVAANHMQKIILATQQPPEEETGKVEK